MDGYPVNSLSAMIRDKSLKTSRKDLVGGLYDTFNKRKSSRQTMNGLMNDIISSCENVGQGKFRVRSIFNQRSWKQFLLQRVVIGPIQAEDLRQRKIDFYERNSSNFDKYKVCTMEKLIPILTSINCPVTKKRTCRFAIDNNFFPSTYWTARYDIEQGNLKLSSE